MIKEQSPAGALERCQLLPRAAQIDQPINRPEHELPRVMFLNQTCLEESVP